ncbi:hypothetical protein ACLKA6_012865 [Drosophila palustris]
MTGHSWSMKEPLIIQRNTHLGDDNQQQQQQHWRQQQQLWRSPHPTVSNCHYHGKSEALRRRRRHPSPHGQASMRQLNGFCCPLRASGSRRYQLQPAQQHQRRQQQRSNWPFYTPSLWQQRQPQMQMGASVALLLLATTLLMLNWGISTPYLATLPPLPWPWQRQQAATTQQHKHSH